jgi:hypothetical protein
VEIVTFDLDDPRLCLPNPVREKGDEHGVSELLCFFIHMELACIDDIRGGFLLVIVIRTFEPVARSERLAIRLAQLSGHIAVRCIHNDPHRPLAHGVERW